MREGWREVRLADVLTRSKDMLGTATEPTILTVTEGKGLVDQFEHWGRRIATEDVSKYKVVQPNALVYNVYLLWLGAIGRNATGQSAITSPVYEVFDVNSSCEPRYVEHLVRSDEMRKAYAGISIGTVPRRRRTPWQAFLQLPIALPPLNEQRRIVDLIAAMDDATEASEEEAEASFASLESLRDLLIWDDAWPREALRDIATVVGGLVDPTDAAHSSLPHIGTERIVSATGDLIGVVSAEEDQVTSGKFLHEAGVVIYSKIRPNLRKVALPDWPGLCSADAYPMLPSEPGDVSFLRHLLLTRAFTREAVSKSGRTKMPKINRRELMSIKVPVVPIEDQARIAQTLDSLDQTRVRARAHAESLRTLRSNLLTVLLSGEHEIPESYDRLLDLAEEGAAA